MSGHAVITGLGVVTPAGDDARRLAGMAMRGEPGPFAPPAVPGFLADRGLRIGTVADPDPEPFLADRKHLKYMDLLSRLAVCAAGLALASARVERGSIDPFRIGTYMAIGFVASEVRDLRPVLVAGRTPRGTFDPALVGGRARINPISVFRSLPNIPACNVSIGLGFRGENTVLYPDAPQAAVALQDAIDALAEGRVDVAVWGGAFQATSFLTLHTLAMLGAMTPAGAPVADGAGVLVLEREQDAARRGAAGRGRVAAVATGGLVGTPYDLSIDEPGLTRLMTRVIAESGDVAERGGILVPGDRGDRGSRESCERAIRSALGSRADRWETVSTRGVTGHALCANLPLDVATALAVCASEGRPAALVGAVGQSGDAAACLLECERP
jgi:3-oxoacyl-[acyl-carrier-protein] synthase II